jgi:ectoine hydroxylase-related dioxygenase (phytanoyl-CoA dioxygenase family)
MQGVATKASAESTTESATAQGHKILTQEQIDSFALNGFLRVGKILEDDEIELLRSEYDREFALARAGQSSFRNLSIDATDDLEQKNQAKQQMLQIMQMCERNIHFRRLLYNERILDVIEDLIGPNIQLFHDQALYKPAFHGGPVHWHQDNAYWRCTPATLVSAWLTLDDVDATNGAMQFMPGTHLYPVGHDRSHVSNSLLDSGGAIKDESQKVVVDLPAGGIAIHHCQTLHYTEPNTTDRQRRAFAIHFMTPGTRSLRTGETLHVSFARPLLRTKV